MNDDSERKVFTGRHMAAVMIAFFGVVIVVNLIMARFAITTYGGLVVDNSYVASQHYNEWLQRAEAQDRLGWAQSARLDADRYVCLDVTKDGKPLDGLTITATLMHPLGVEPARPIRFEPMLDGSLRSTTAAPQGRWRLEFSVKRGSDEARYREELK